MKFQLIVAVALVAVLAFVSVAAQQGDEMRNEYAPVSEDRVLLNAESSVEATYAITAAQLSACTGIPPIRANAWVAPINAAAAKYAINGPRRMAAFIAQTAHESGLYTDVLEGTNYSAAGLRATFPKYFTAVQASQYARQPVRIANRAYANRMGNGNEASGDGDRYRGRGLIQITGRGMYARVGTALGQNFIANPTLLEQPQWAAMSAAWFFAEGAVANLNTLADALKITRITELINGGFNGLADRKALYNKACSVLKC